MKIKKINLKKIKGLTFKEYKREKESNWIGQKERWWKKAVN